MPVRRLAAVCLVLLAGCASASKQRAPATSAEDLPDSAAAQDLARAFRARMRVWTKRDGTPVYVSHCRRAPGGCERRIDVFSRLLASAAQAHGLDPFLLGALAMRESALNPGAVGAAGEAGLVQLHPRGVGRGMRFVQDEDYREQCVERGAPACQRPILKRAARMLSKAIDECGSLVRALGKYNSGRCSPRPGYTRHVLEERDRLRRLAER
jgi:hypothetical protein